MRRAARCSPRKMSWYVPSSSSLTHSLAHSLCPTQLPPVSRFPEDEVNTASHGLISRHAHEWPQERILRQRHEVRVVPVSQANYVWKDSLQAFWVYGLDGKVHAPDYPQQMCFGACSLM